MRKQPGRSSASTACDSTSPKTDSHTASNWWLSSSLIWGERRVMLGVARDGTEPGGAGDAQGGICSIHPRSPLWGHVPAGTGGPTWPVVKERP